MALLKPARGGRREPYTENGIARMSCYRCTSPASSQWSVCAMDNYYIPICQGCDVELNLLVMKWANVPSPGELMARYTGAGGGGGR